MKTTRRSFLQSAALASTALALKPFHAEAASGALSTDPMRPQFHLLPASNWMNDPNGPIYYRGKYHMFFQYNPEAAVWGNMSWYHAVSPDMLHWQGLPVAMTPTPDGPDAAGCFSGSTLYADVNGTKRVYALYTGVVRDKAHDKDRHELRLDDHLISLQPGDNPTLHAWVDGSVLEVLAGERVGYTKRFYYSAAVAPDVAVHVQGLPAQLALWSVQPVSPDRLSTPAA